MGAVDSLYNEAAWFLDSFHTFFLICCITPPAKMLTHIKRFKEKIKKNKKIFNKYINPLLKKNVFKNKNNTKCSFLIYILIEDNK